MKNLLLPLLLLTIPATLNASPLSQDTPEIASKRLPAPQTQSATGTKYMAVTADPHATKAAYDILKSGGTAADAAIAAQFVLGLTEPQSSGLGGGAFALYYDAQTQKLTTYDARETAPLAAHPGYFLKADGTPMKFFEAVLGGRSIGVPGTPALLEKLHKNHGKTDKTTLVHAAQQLATNGFKKSSRLQESLEADKGRLDQNSFSKEYFYNGDTLINDDYASVLKIFTLLGGSAFYKEPLSTNIINFANHAGGILTQQDFDNYKVITRPAVCDNALQHKICSMGQPSSGGLTMLQILKLIDDNPTWHNYIEASKLAFADRNHYMADPDFVQTPDTLLLDDKYIQTRKSLIQDNTILINPPAGIPAGWKKNTSEHNGPNVPGTTHISIIDSYGNAISMTSTIENAFGSRIMTNGYLLNNELTDFSFLPEKDGHLIANRVEGGKRPRSSMAPTIVFDLESGKPTLLIGSAGGSSIIGYTSQGIIDILHNDMIPAEALAAPHILNRGNLTESEQQTDISQGLKQKGHIITNKTMTSGLTAIHIDPKTNKMRGAADPRRIGIAMGE